MRPPHGSVSSNALPPLFVSLTITAPAFAFAATHARLLHLSTSGAHTGEPDPAGKLGVNQREEETSDGQIAARLQRGVRAYENNRLDEAIAEFSAIIDSNPKSF